MIKIKYLDTIRDLDIPCDIKNGTLQKELLNMFNLIIYDIKCMVFKYTEHNLICGYNDTSFYSKFIKENLIDIVILDKNSTNIIIQDLDFKKLQESFNTYLISLDDEMFLNNQNNNISSHLFSLDNIINIVNENTENEVNAENTENEVNAENTENEVNAENAENEVNTENETPVNNLETYLSIYSNSQVIQINNNQTENVMQFLEYNLFNILNNTLINSINNELIETQENVKIVMKKEDFDKINIIPIIENKGSCSICLESMTTNIIKLECNHYYHKDCAEEWLCKCSNKCPICKTEISEGIPLE